MAFTGNIGHIEIESPFGNAGGVVKSLEDVRQMAQTGVGWIEAGSYTVKSRLGNAWNQETKQFDKVVYHHDPEAGVTYNSLGMPNKGMFDDLESDTEPAAYEFGDMADWAHTYGKPFVANVAPVSEDPVEEVRELVIQAYEHGADAVLVNAGCPNVVKDDGDRHELLSRDPAALALVLAGLKGITRNNARIFLRVSPLRGLGLDRVAQVVNESEVVSAVFTPNTWPGALPTKPDGTPVLDVPGGVGGASGPAYADKSLVEAEMWAHELRNSGIDVVRSSGISTGAELKRGLGRKGVVAGAGTTFFYTAETDWSKAVHYLLDEAAI